MKLDLLLDSASAKIMGVAIVAAPIAASTPINQSTTQIIGAPLTTLVSALVGSACAYGIKAEPNRYKLFAGIAVYAVLGCACVTLLPWYFERTVPAPVQGPLALMLACAWRFVAPVLAEHGPAFIRNWLGGKAPPPKE